MSIAILTADNVTRGKVYGSDKSLTEAGLLHELLEISPQLTFLFIKICMTSVTGPLILY